jgi:uncharacterized protein YijF (DUF1287 family)
VSKTKNRSLTNNKFMQSLTIKKCVVIILMSIFLSGCGKESVEIENTEDITTIQEVKSLPSHPLVESARKQIGIVTKYDTGYYAGGYPPEDRGACTDVIERALKENDYDLKEKIDEDMKKHPDRYPTESDPNINFRRVRNVKIFLDHHAEKLPTCTTSDCLSEQWKPGDIVTYDQIPGSLWHIAIVSNRLEKEGSEKVPLLVHNLVEE